MNLPRLINLLLLTATFSTKAPANPSIHTKIISGGEVAIMEVSAKHEGQSLHVSGTGFEVFPFRTCGYARITFLDAEGKTLLIKDAEYKTPEWRFTSPRRSSHQNRFVSFSVLVPVGASVALVQVQHESNGGCLHDWSLQYALDWCLNRMIALSLCQ